MPFINTIGGSKGFGRSRVNVDLPDPYWKYTATLLQGDVSNTNLTYNSLSDSSGTLKSITPKGDVWSSPFSPYNTSWSYQFNGDDGVYFPANTANVFGTGDFTVEAWVFWAGNNGGYYDRIVSSGADGVSGSWQFAINGPGGSNTFGLWTTPETFYVSGTMPVGKWTHVAVTRAGTSMRLFIDGTLTSTVTNSTNFSNNDGILVGRYWDSSSGSGQFNGYISNLRLVKGRAVYTGSFTPPTAMLTATSGGTSPPQGTECGLLTCKSKKFEDFSTYGLVPTTKSGVNLGTPRVSGFSPFSETDTTTGSFYSTANSGAFALTPYSSDFEIGSSDWTFESWLYIIGDGEICSAFNNTTVGSPFPGWLVGTNFSSTNKLSFFHASASTNQTFTSTASIGSYQWKHIALSKSGNTLRMYIDGVLDSTHSLTITSIGSNQEIHFAADGNSLTTPGRRFNGYINDLRIVKGTALYTGSTLSVPSSSLTAVSNTKFLAFQTRGEIQNLTVRDESKFNNIVTRSGNCAQGAFSPFSQEEGKWSIFKDSSSRITAANSADFQFGTGNFTVESWVFIPSGPVGDYVTSSWGIIIQCADSGSWNNGWTLSTNDQSGNLRMIWYENNTSLLTSSSNVPRDQWVHVAVSRSGTSIRMFFNGSEVASTTSSYNYVPTRDLSIGGENSGGSYQFSNGYISNLKVVKGTALYTSAFTPSTSPLTADANTKLLALSSNRFVDKSSSARALTGSGNISVEPFTPFGRTTPYKPTVNGGSVYLDGSSDRLTIVDNDAAFAFLSSDFTVEAWVYPFASGITAGDPIFNQSTGGAASDSQNYFSLKADGGSTYLSDGTGWDYWAQTSSSFALGRQWNHVAWVRNGTTLACYINGTRQATATLPSGWSAGNSSRVIEIGSQDTANYFNGYIHGLRVIKGTAVYTGSTYTVPTSLLTATADTTLLLNFTGPGIIDKSANVNFESVGAYVDTSVKKYGSGSLAFNGTSDYIISDSTTAIPKIGTGDFTVECWIKLPSVTPTGCWRGIVSIGDGYNTSGSFTLYAPRASSPANTAVVIIDMVNPTLGGTTNVNDNQWHHIAVTRSSGTLRIFVDGNLDASVANTANITRQSVVVGRDVNCGTTFYQGYIDDLRITVGYARYTSAFTSPSRALPAK